MLLKFNSREQVAREREAKKPQEPIVLDQQFSSRGIDAIK